MRRWRSSTLCVLVAALVACAWPSRPAKAFEDAVEHATARVVKLYGLGAGRQVGYGSGVVVSPEGEVLTVLSLLIEATPVRATDHEGNKYEADVVYRDRSRQLALLQLRKAGTMPGEDEGRVSGLPWFDLNKETELRPGDWIIAAGNAFKVAEGDEPVSIAHGVFSIRRPLDARRRMKDFPYRGDVLVIDAITSNPGGPGGAVVNLDGDFVGLTGRFVESNLTNTHFNYAMPVDVLQAFLREARNPAVQAEAAARRVEQAEAPPLDVGIRLARQGYQQTLPFVDRVKRGSPARRAGIRQDDLILSVNGRSITSVEEYESRMKGLSLDEPINFVVKRGRKIITIRVGGEEEG